MPSYAQEVKNELARKFDKSRECQRTELVALLKVGAREIDGRIEFSNSNAAVARKVITLAKKFFPAVKPEVAAVRKKTLMKDLRYVVRFIAIDEVKTFFDPPELDELLKRTRFKVAYLRGAFLARGMVNRPEAEYFLPIVKTKAEALFLQKLMINLDFNAGFRQRRKEFLAYLRGGDDVCDFLGMIGANNAVERFEVARNIKEVRMQVNRVVNMETAALNRSIDAAQRQLSDIKILLGKKVPVNHKLREAMKMRLENPTSTVGELAEKLSITREGLMYRFNMIHSLAEKFSKK
ncbi:MAG: DNA-binding protein WhiA [Selenomonadaceae bacterium]|nr:DNA-binding protein WhiA [Selenomonadaceae bacterium]